MVVMVRSELLAAKRFIVFRGDDDAEDDVTLPPFVSKPLLAVCGGDFSAFCSQNSKKNEIV